MNLKIKKLNPNAIIPKYGSTDAAGMDLYALLDKDTERILPNETKLIHTGISVAIPEGYVGLIFARSGLATKHGLAPANKVGVIDADYRGEIMVALHNHQSEMKAKSWDEGDFNPAYNAEAINNGDRIAQMVIVPYVHADLEEVDELDETVRGEGGFGSTGTN